jgi:hypothetical protein
MAAPITFQRIYRDSGSGLEHKACLAVGGGDPVFDDFEGGRE